MSGSDLIELRSGPFVRADAIALACSLEARGHMLSSKDGALLCTNGSALAKADVEAIKANRAHLIAIVTYEAPRLEA